MQVFKNYFKILKDHWFSVGLYSFIFIGVLLISTQTDRTSEVYDSVNVGITVKDEAETELSKGLYSYLDANANIVQIDDEFVDDRLFYQTVSAALTIPKDFEENRQVIFKSAPKDMYGLSIKEKISSYLSQVSSYETACFSEKESIEFTKKYLKKKADVSLKDKTTHSVDKKSRFYFNFYNYSIIAQIVLIVSTLTLTYKDEDIYKRNAISPIRRTRQNLELYLGHIVAGLAAWLIYMILYMVLNNKGPATNYVRLMMINSLIFTLTTVAMAIYISKLTKSGNSMAAIMNIVSLGSSFLSGAFVPQEFLGDTALKLGKLLPSYYYVTNNNLLAAGGSLEIYKTNMLIMLAFAFAFIVLSLIFKENLKKTI